MGRPAWIRPVMIRLIYNVFVFSIYLFFFFTLIVAQTCMMTDIVTCYTEWRMPTSDHYGKIRLRLQKTVDYYCIFFNHNYSFKEC